jgi:hypothetical protein
MTVCRRARTGGDPACAQARLAKLFLLAALLLLLQTASAHAIVLVPLSTEELHEMADSVIVARVESLTNAPQYHPGSTRLRSVSTEVRLVVERVDKGRARARQTIQVPGGSANGRRMEVPGGVAFVPGERVLLFLDEQGRVIGGPQGKVPLERSGPAGEDGGYKFAHTAFSAAATAASAGALTPSPLQEPVSTASTPVISSMSPRSGSAGTGTLVAVRGSGFGAVRGTGRVDFTYRTGVPITARILFWSDTEIVCEVPIGLINGYPGSAATGPVKVTNAAGLSSTGYDFAVTFAYGGVAWDFPDIGYRVNANTTDTNLEGDLVRAAAATWSLPSPFSLTFDGSCSTTTFGFDGRNDIFWSSTELPAGVLALTSYWHDDVAIVEADVCFNDTYVWGTGSGSTYDVESVALHEFGHWLNLRDLYGADSPKVMYGFASAGVQKRTLHADDRAGIMWIYGERDTQPPTAPSLSSPSHPSPAVWYQSRNASFSFAATDPSGIVAYSYLLDSKPTTVPDIQIDGTSGSATYAGVGDGLWYFHVRAVDAAGNWGPSSHLGVRIDGSPPLTTSDAQPSYTGSATISLTPSDSHSGVAETWFRLDGGQWTAGTSATTSSPGPHTLEFYSKDIAGNIEGTRSITFAVESPVNLVTLPAGWSIIAGGPGSDSLGATLYSFTGSHYESTVASAMTAGAGYWIRLPTPATVSLTATPAPLSVSLTTGWNLTGNSTGVAVTIPSGLTGYVFDGSRYLSKSRLEPGQGAWIRSAGPQSLTLAAAG